MTHTPGPLSWAWEPRYSEPETVDLWISGPDECPVAQVYGETGEQAEANAALFCAAPDLLAACERAADVLAFWGHDADTPTREALRAAIARARGTDA